MNVLSLFDGMSCGQIALIELGIKPDKYYASEIDKYAIGQSKLNFPGMIHLGSVVNVDVSQLEPIDLLIGGSPCQSFSFAGKRKGMSTKCEIQITRLEQYLQLKSEGFEFEGQSYLFWEYMRILTDIRKYNPDVKFLLENVEMGAKWERILSEAIGVFGVHINSALVSAQNRKRIYWTNIRTKQVGLFGELHSDIPQPKDMGIFLKDILESEVDEKYFISQKVLDRIDRKTYSEPQFNPDKTGTLNTKNNSGQMSIDSGTTFISINGKSPAQRSSTGRSMDKKHNYQVINLDGIPKVNQDKASCFTAGGNSGGNHSDMDLICVAMRGRNPDNPSDRTTGAPTEQRLEPKTDGKTNCLTSVKKDNLVMCLNKWQKKNYTETDVKANSIMASFYKGNGTNGMSLFNQNQRIRRLTPTECARLQTVPDWYKWECSDTQIYKMCGNGWTVEVIKHILSYL